MGFLAIFVGVLYCVALVAGELFGEDAMIPAVFFAIEIPYLIHEFRELRVLKKEETHED